MKQDISYYHRRCSAGRRDVLAPLPTHLSVGLRDKRPIPNLRFPIDQVLEAEETARKRAWRLAEEQEVEAERAAGRMRDEAQYDAWIEP